MKHSVLIFDFGSAWPASPPIIAKLLVYIHDLLQNLRLLVLRVSSIEEIERQIGSSKPRLVIVPACKKAVGALPWIKLRFPKVQIVMVYPAEDTPEGFQERADAIMDAAGIGGILLLNARKAKAALKKRLSETFFIMRPGMKLDGYRLRWKIGKGGFGTTWLAVNMKTHRFVALKVIEGNEQIRQELGALQKYVQVSKDCQYLIQVEHINGDGSRLWFVTRLADSTSLGWESNVKNYRPMDLRHYLEARGQLPEQDAIQIVRDLLTGLSVLHKASLLHGDITLTNILRINGRWVLADPGLVRFIGDPARYVTRGYYPEPLTGMVSDDLHAVAVILWQLIMGRKDPRELDGFARKTLSAANSPLSRIISKAIARDSQQRYHNADQMLRDVQSLLRRSTKND